MNSEIQDRIDEYILNRMSEEEKIKFEQEVAADPEMKAQLEMTRTMREALCSREDKLKRLREMKARYDQEHPKDERGAAESAGMRKCNQEEFSASEVAGRKPWLSRLFWISGIAAMLVSGVFLIRPLFMEDFGTPNPETAPVRGGEDDVPFDYDYTSAPPAVTDTLTEEDSVLTEILTEEDSVVTD